MKSTEYIEWDKLEQIPFCLCRIAEDEENQEIDVYYLDKRVCHDYDHVGHYFRTAIIMFRRIRNITADWVNLKNLWLLRDCTYYPELFPDDVHPNARGAEIMAGLIYNKITGKKAPD